MQLFIEERLDQELSLEELAKLAHFSPYHFHRVFRALVGESVYEYIKRLRLESAATRLRITERSVLDIALESGYESHEGFTRAFRQRFGVSPSEFRAGATPTRTFVKEIPMPVDTPSLQVEVKTLNAIRVAFLRHVGPYLNVGPTFGKLGEWMGKKGHIGPKTIMLGICHDDPKSVEPEKLRYDCCFSVADSFQPTGEIGTQDIPGGSYAVLTHKGPYSGLESVYHWLYSEWLPTSGREPRNQPPFEIYRNTPMDTAPENLITEICVPLV